MLFKKFCSSILLVLLFPFTIHAQQNPFSSFGLGVDGIVQDIQTSPDGEIFVGGYINVAGNKKVQSITKFDGSEWVELGRTSNPNNHVRHMHLAGDILYVAFNYLSYSTQDNEFYTPQGITLSLDGGMLAYNLTDETWSKVEFEDEVTRNVSAITSDNSTVYLAANSQLWKISNGNRADSLTSGFPRVNWSYTPSAMITALEYHDGKLYVGGRFNELYNTTKSINEGDEPVLEAQHVAAWDLENNRWEKIGDGFGGSGPIALSSVYALHVDESGNLYAGGLMNTILSGSDEITTNGFAMWDGNNWSPVGLGVDPDDNRNRIMDITSHNGKIYVAGRFEYVIQADGTTIDTKDFAVWNGSEWETDENGVSITKKGTHHDLYENDAETTSSDLTDNMLYAVQEHNGEIYIGGSFERILIGDEVETRINARNIAKFNDGEYSAIGSGVDDLIFDVVKAGDDYYLTGLFTYGYNENEKIELHGVAKYNTSTNTLEALGQGIGECRLIATSGTPCSNVGVKLVYDDENDELYVGGRFNGAYQQDGSFVESPMAIKWDGSSWQNLGNGLSAGMDILEYDYRNGIDAQWLLDMQKDGNKIYFAGKIEEIDGGNVDGKLVAIWNIQEQKWESLPLPENYSASSVRTMTFVDDEIWFGGHAGEELSEPSPVFVYNKTTQSSERNNLTYTSSSSLASASVFELIADGNFIYAFGDISIPGYTTEDGEEIRLSSRLNVYDRTNKRWASIDVITSSIQATSRQAIKKGNFIYTLNMADATTYNTAYLYGDEIMRVDLADQYNYQEIPIRGSVYGLSEIEENQLLATGKFLYHGDFDDNPEITRSATFLDLSDTTSGPLLLSFLEELEQVMFSDSGNVILELPVGNIGNEAFTGYFEISYQDGDNWISISEETVDFGAKSSKQIGYQILSSSMEPGEYEAEIILKHSDTDNTALTFPLNITIDPLQAPVNPKPANDAQNLSLNTTLEWELPNATVAEQIFVLFSTNSDDLEQNILYSGEVKFQQDSLPELEYETTYYWQVVSNEGTNLEYSDIWKFTTRSEDAFFVELISPANDSANLELPVSFTWTENQQADSYQIQISKDADFSTTIIDSSGISETAITFDDLSHETTYYWKVRPQSESGNGEWSSVWNFTTQKDEESFFVELISPENDFSDLAKTATFRWSEHEQADSYHFQLSKSSGFSSFTVDSTSEDTTLTIRGLKEKTAFYWRVRPQTETENGDWSSVWTFTTKSPIFIPEVVQLHLPEDEAENLELEVEFIWFKSENTEHYAFQLSEDADFNELVIDSTSHSDTTLTAGNLKESSMYWWRVRSFNNDTASAWSDTLSFSTMQLTGTESERDLPKEISIDQNYPNPFNPTTNIRFGLPQKSNISLAVYDMLGRKVADIESGVKNAGYHTITFDASGLSSGLYIYRLESSQKSITRKMLLIK